MKKVVILFLLRVFAHIYIIILAICNRKDFYSRNISISASSALEWKWYILYVFYSLYANSAYICHTTYTCGIYTSFMIISAYQTGDAILNTSWQNQF